MRKTDPAIRTDRKSAVLNSKKNEIKTNGKRAFHPIIGNCNPIAYQSIVSRKSYRNPGIDGVVDAGIQLGKKGSRQEGK